MEGLSAFDELGMWECSGRPTHSERMYESAIAGLSKAFDVAPGSRMDAISYANAMMCARIKYAAEHAAGQAIPDTIDVLLPPVERSYGLVPGPRDTIDDRRTALATRRRIPVAASKRTIERTLRELLGDDFVAVVPTAVDDLVRYPDAFGDPPMLLVPVSVTRKTIRLLQPVFPDVDGSTDVRYEPVLDTGEEAEVSYLEPGDSIVVEPETDGLTEPVTIYSVGVDDDGVATFTVAGTFENAHSEGAVAAQMPFPAQASTKRHTLIVLTPTAAVDATARRKVNDYMNRSMRASSTWSIVGGEDGETGVFTIGTSPLGAQTLGSVDYT